MNSWTLSLERYQYSQNIKYSITRNRVGKNIMLFYKFRAYFYLKNYTGMVCQPRNNTR